jgi:hypothetical protein
MYIKVCTDDSMYLWSTDGWEPYKLVRAYQVDGDAPGVYSGHDVVSGLISADEALSAISAIITAERVRELEQASKVE